MCRRCGLRTVTVHSNCIDYLDTIGGSCYTLGQSYTKRADTVGHSISTRHGGCYCVRFLQFWAFNDGMCGA